MIVGDILARMGEDPDLEGIDPSWPVVMGDCATTEESGWHDATKVERFTRAYADGEPMPPIVLMRWTTVANPAMNEWLVTGAHRRAAAHRAGIARIPAYVIMVPS